MIADWLEYGENGNLPVLRTRLNDPWDARWLADLWPDIFTLSDDARGEVTMHDISQVWRLPSGVELGSSEDGLVLWVHGTPYGVTVG